MNALEEYQLRYELYCAEQEMIDSIVSISSLVTESTGIMIIQETVKDTIMRYLTRISQAISKTYTRFTSELHKKINDPFLKKFYKNRIDTDFNITNFPTYSLDKLDQIKLLDFNYDQMKDKLDSRADYIKAYYPMLQNPDNIKESMKTLSILSRKDTTVSRDMIDDMYDFCTNRYEKYIESMKKDFDQVNKSNKEIEKLVSTVMATNEVVSIVESLILEAPVNTAPETSLSKVSQADKKNDEKIGFRDDEEKKQKEKEARAKITKVVTTYTSVSTEIIVQKMNCIKDCFNTYIKILRHASSSEKKEQDETQIQTTKQTDTQVHY